MKETICEFIKLKGMTMSELAKKSGVHRHTIDSAMKRPNSVKIETLIRVLNSIGYETVITFKRRKDV